jgi:hypothetical protein
METGLIRTRMILARGKEAVVEDLMKFSQSSEVFIQTQQRFRAKQLRMV